MIEDARVQGHVLNDIKVSTHPVFCIVGLEESIRFSYPHHPLI